MQKEKGERQNSNSGATRCDVEAGDRRRPWDIRERSFQFAVRVVRLCRRLDGEPGVGRTLGRQLIRAGTSIGANIEEAQAGQSRADFIAKTSIALKEARETHYWLRLLAASDVLSAPSSENSNKKRTN